MPRYFGRVFRCFVCVLIFAGLFPVIMMTVGLAEAADNDISRAKTITFGQVGSKPSLHNSQLRAITDFLRESLIPHGIDAVDYRYVADYATLENMLRSGDVDLVTDSLFAGVRLERDAGAEIFLDGWRSSGRRYRASIVVQQDSPINTLADLKGRTIAFEDRYSTSGTMMQRADLMEAGLDLVELPSVHERAPADKVGFTYLFKDDVQISAVLAGKTDAAAVSENDIYRLPARLRQQLKIIHLGPEVPRFIMLVRGDLEPSIKVILRNILLTAHETPAGRAALVNFAALVRFAEPEPADLRLARGKYRYMIGDVLQDPGERR